LLVTVFLQMIFNLQKKTSQLISKSKIVPFIIDTTKKPV
jgi:hypothetical protein